MIPRNWDDSILAKLAKARAFVGLGAGDLESLASCFSLEVYQPESIVIKQNEFTSKVYFIIDGEVEIILQNSETFETAPIAILRAGDTVGEFALLGNAKRTASARALVRCELLAATSKTLLNLFNDNPRIAHIVYRNLCGVLVDRIINLNQIARRV